MKCELPTFLAARLKLLPGGCWEWTGSRSNAGYGRVGRHAYAHRLAWEHAHGAIPSDLQIDHVCRNRACVNPAHMELVSARENTRRGLAGAHKAQENRAKTHCPHSHPYSGPNLTVDRRGWRRCKACAREKARFDRRRKEAAGAM